MLNKGLHQSFSVGITAISILVVSTLLVCASCRKKKILKPDPSRLMVTTLHTGMNEPMELAILPDGQILFIERPGNIKKYDPVRDTVQTVGVIEVLYELENGLLGLTLDPDFGNNLRIYLFYTSPDTLVTQQHVSRFELWGDSLLLSSEKVLLTIPIDRDICCHSGGCLEFGPDGNLYISTGDNTNPTEFGPIDERPGHRNVDSQRTAANTLDLRGKILRIRPQADGTYTIPEGNLFDARDPLARAEIYIMGNRNPFRMSVDALTGVLYWGDMGPNPSGGKDSLRGPRSHEEINRAEEAGNYGWPYLLADNKPYRDFDYQGHELGAPFDPESLVNDSPNNTGLKKLPSANGALIWYPNTPSDLFPEVGTGGGAAIAGPVYRYNQNPGSKWAIPEHYDGKLFVFDWMRSWIVAVSIDDTGNFAGIEPFLPVGEFKSPIDMEVGPNGGLYVLDYGSHWYIQNADARLALITYATEELPSADKVESDQFLQAAPDLSIDFASNRSFYYPDEIYNYAIEAKELESAISARVNDYPINVRLHYFPDPEDLNILGEPFSIGKSLIEQSDCAACHVDKGFSLGPRFSKISNRYQDRKDLVDLLSQKVLTGGGGVWGEFNMPPHPQHSIEEASQMVQYILSISQELTKEEILPITGSFKTKGEVSQGRYVLSAFYSDPAGGQDLIETGANLILRHPLVRAVSYDSARDVAIQSSEGRALPFVKIEKNGAFLAYHGIDLRGIGSLFFRFRSSAQSLRVEARLDSAEGLVIGVTENNWSGDDHEVDYVSEMGIDEVDGQHDLYFVLDSDDKESGDDGIARIESIYFHSEGRVVPF